MEITIGITTGIIILILGYNLGVLHQRWVYYNKRGEHLQDVERDPNAIKYWW